MIVSYSPRQVADSHSYSPSAAKPKELLAYLKARNHAIEVVEPAPMTLVDLRRAHDPQYLRGIMDLTTRNGFGNYSAAVRDSLPYTSGSMYQACKSALENKHMAASFTSGFHHAGWNHCGGFCTLNGLMVAALKIQAEKLAKRILILDCDYHYGNGTDDILRHLKIGPNHIKHISFGAAFSVPEECVDYLNRLEKLTRDLDAFDLVIYQAGADVHVDDPLGGVLNTAQMAERDHLVFGRCLAARVPLAWNLAGGYQRDANGGIEAVLKLHEQTFSIGQALLEQSFYARLVR
jgi:acetoin utilization deacetylase AcuC-like enzyme